MRRLVILLIALPMLALAFGPQVRNMMLEIASRRDVEPTTEGLVAYWSMRESGGTVFDEQGNHDGTVGGNVGAVLFGSQYGIRNDGADFDGSSGYVDLTAMGAFGQTVGESTFSLWFSMTQNDKESVVLGVINDDAQLLQLILNRLGSQGHLEISLRDERDGESLTRMLNKRFARDLGFTDGAWHHLSVSFDAPNAEIYAYLNGELLTDPDLFGANSPYIFIDWEHSIALGARNTRSTISLFAEASVDELRFYDRILTPEEHAGLYNWDKAGAGH